MRCRRSSSRLSCWLWLAYFGCTRGQNAGLLTICSGIKGLSFQRLRSDVKLDHLFLVIVVVVRCTMIASPLLFSRLKSASVSLLDKASLAHGQKITPPSSPNPNCWEPGSLAEDCGDNSGLRGSPCSSFPVFSICLELGKHFPAPSGGGRCLGTSPTMWTSLLLMSPMIGCDLFMPSFW